eukprot:3747133-Rhodomonas_salina.3
MSGTDIANACANAIALRTCCAMSGTDMAYAATSLVPSSYTVLGTDKGYAATRLAFPLTMSFSGISVAAFEAEKATFRALAAAAFTFNVASDCTPAPTVANWDNYLCDTASPLARLGCHEEVGRQIFDIQAAEAGEEGLITVSVAALACAIAHSRPCATAVPASKSTSVSSWHDAIEVPMQKQFA